MYRIDNGLVVWDPKDGEPTPLSSTYTTDAFAPRALLHRDLIDLPVTPFEASLLIEALEARACRLAENPEFVDIADHWFLRAAQLREACR
jgi:hypothetical protein